MERQIDEDFNRLLSWHRESSPRRKLHQVRGSLRSADQIKHSRHYSSPSIGTGFRIGNVLVNGLLNFLVSGFDDRAFLATSRSSSATAISSSCVSRF